MKNKISSPVFTVIFDLGKQTNEQLNAFLDCYFEVSALNYKDDGSEEFVGYADFFDSHDFQKKASGS